MASDLQQLINGARSELVDYFIQNLENGISNDEVSEFISEIADQSIPVYTSDILQCAMDDHWLATETPEIEADNAIDCIKYNLYTYVENELREFWAECESVIESYQENIDNIDYLELDEQRVTLEDAGYDEVGDFSEDELPAILKEWYLDLASDELKDLL